jgi:hypothetical protein
MPSEDFWRIIARAAESAHDPDAHVDALRMALRALSLEEIMSFEAAFRRHLNQAYTWDLWGAAYVINGGCSDDGFEYFRRWLVSRGRDVYEAALADPESLAQLDAQPGPDDLWEFEEICYVAPRVFEEKGGQGDVRDQAEPEAGLAGAEPSGKPFSEDEEHLARRYPDLVKRFGPKPPGGTGSRRSEGSPRRLDDLIVGGLKAGRAAT